MNPYEFIENNISSEPYCSARLYLRSLDPPLSFKDLPNYMINQADEDIQIFQTRERKRLINNTPLVGDAILRKDGRTTFIGTFLHGTKLQDTEGGSFYLAGESHMSYSGSFTMDVIDASKLKPTKILTAVWCWIFSQDQPGGNRGVYSKINVKTWQEV